MIPRYGGALLWRNNSEVRKLVDYRTERYETVVPVEEYMEQCVDVPTFLEYCRQCPSYRKLWSCPPFDFDPEAYWRRYGRFRIIGIKIFLPEELTSKSFTNAERTGILNETLWEEKKKLNAELYALEQKIPGSVSLSAGPCMNCDAENCARLKGEPCRFPEKLRHSIESLGGNVGLTVTKYLHQNLLWIEDGRLPEHFMLVCGLLMP